jgi:hypothetical protein
MKDELSRRDFTVQTALALLSGVAITVSGCGSSSTPTSPSTPTPGPSDVNGAITANHGHTAVVTAARITAHNDIALDIRGTADHPHTVQLTGAELESIGGGARVSKTSTTDAGHNHTVTFN